MRKLVIFYVIYLANSANPENFDENLYKLVNEIYEEYFQVFNCVTFAADDINNILYLRKTLPLLMINLLINNSYVTTNDVLKESFEQGCRAYIIQTNEINRPSMVRALIDAKNQAIRYRYNKERYLFLPVDEKDTKDDILSLGDMFYLPNFLLVSPKNRSFALKGHTTFDPEKHEYLEVLDTWSVMKGYNQSVNLYPDRIKNVRGKQLVLGLIHYIPYSVIVHEGNNTIYDGVETRIATQFVKFINGSYQGLDHPIELWGNKFPNGSGNGIFGSVQRHKADLGYAAIYQWYCDVLDCSYPYIQAEVICLVPKPQKLTNWMTIVLPFTESTWITLCIAYLICCSVVFGLILASKYLHGKRKLTDEFLLVAFQSAYYIFRLQMQQIPKSAHGKNPLAVYVRIIILYYFSISLFWQGGIASILTVPRYEKPIDTATDLLSRWPKVKWGSNHDVWIYSIENSTQPVLRQIVKKFKVLDYDTLVKKTRTRDFAYFLEKLPNKHYGFSEHINEDTVPYLRLMKNNIYTGFAVMILPRGSPYTEKLDHLIHWLFATGITQKMEIQVSLERINNHLQNMIRFSDEKESGRVILTISHIQGSIYIYCGGIFISLTVLIGEIFVFLYSSKYKRSK